MTRKQLEELGLEKEIIDKVMAMHGEDINKYKDYVPKDEYIAKTELNNYISKEELANNYVDKKTYDELNKFNDELSKFKTDTINANNKKAQNDNLLKYLDSVKVDKKVQNLLLDKLGAEFDENNSLKNADIVKQNIDANFKDFLVVESQGGNKPMTPPPNNQSASDPFIAGFDSK